ncbi:MAG: hypothetical protein FD164_1699 [Nitrospirae bacterium]|nr:MAG: hypothetical protein FD164_1699 [Nitrospirota bacterium]
MRYFLRYKPGWWVLHIIAVVATFWLGASVRFPF